MTNMLHQNRTIYHFSTPFNSNINWTLKNNAGAVKKMENRFNKKFVSIAKLQKSGKDSIVVSKVY